MSYPVGHCKNKSIHHCPNTYRILVWLCRPHNEADASGQLSLTSPTKVIFKFRNPAHRAIYARFLQLHPRCQFKGESNYWSDQGGQELSNAPSSDDEFPSVDLPFATGETADKCILFFPLFFSLYSYYQFWRELHLNLTRTF